MSTRSVHSPNVEQAPLILFPKEHPSIKSLTEYLLSKTNPDPALRAILEETLAPSSNNHVGLIFSERLVNMPVQIIPPMYRMLADEIKWAIEEVGSPLAIFFT